MQLLGGLVSTGDDTEGHKMQNQVSGQLGQQGQQMDLASMVQGGQMGNMSGKPMMGQQSGASGEQNKFDLTKLMSMFGS